MVLAQIVIPAACVAAASLAALLAADVLRRDRGPASRRDATGAILESAGVFLGRHYLTTGLLAVLIALAAGVAVGSFRESTEDGALTGVAFVGGALASAVATGLGTALALRASAGAAAAAARHAPGEAISTALRGGSVSGLLVVSLALATVTGLFAACSRLLGNPVEETPFLVAGFAFGASFVALFAQLGGGIAKNAATVAASAAGQAAPGVPVDEPGNVAAVAALAGDHGATGNGRSADLFASTGAVIVAALIVAGPVYAATGEIAWMVFPLVLAAFGAFASTVGVVVVSSLAARVSDPLVALLGGHWLVTVLSLAGLAVATAALLGDAWHWFFYCGLAGLSAGIAFVYFTHYRIPDVWHHWRETDATPSGLAAAGAAASFGATAVTALVLGATAIASFALGQQANVRDLSGTVTGVFGIAVAATGMLMPAAYVLAINGLGPVGGNAAGIGGLALEPDPEAQAITTAIASAGDRSRALVRGYALGAAAFVAFLLVLAFLGQVRRETARIALEDPARYVALARDNHLISGDPAVQAQAIADAAARQAAVEAVREAIDDGDRFGLADARALMVADDREATAIIESKVRKGEITAADVASLVGPDGSRGAPVPLPPLLPLDVAKVNVFAGALLGGMLVFVVASLSLRAVGRTAAALAEEVGRQAREPSPRTAGESRGGHGSAAAVTVRTAWWAMLLPALAALGTPVVAGLLFRYAYSGDGNEGWATVAGLLVAGAIGGALLATCLEHAGGARPAASGMAGGGPVDGSGSAADGVTAASAALVIDAGAPFRDTAGPTLHVLMKLFGTAAVVLAPLFIS